MISFKNLAALVLIHQLTAHFALAGDPFTRTSLKGDKDLVSTVPVTSNSPALAPAPSPLVKSPCLCDPTEPGAASFPVSLSDTLGPYSIDNLDQKTDDQLMAELFNTCLAKAKEHVEFVSGSKYACIVDADLSLPNPDGGDKPLYIQLSQKDFHSNKGYWNNFSSVESGDAEQISTMIKQVRANAGQFSCYIGGYFFCPYVF